MRLYPSACSYFNQYIKDKELRGAEFRQKKQATVSSILNIMSWKQYDVVAGKLHKGQCREE